MKMFSAPDDPALALGAPTPAWLDRLLFEKHWAFGVLSAAGVFIAAALLVLWLNWRHENFRPLGPHKVESLAKAADAKRQGVLHEDLKISVPERGGQTITEFILAESTGFQRLGRIQMRLDNVDGKRGAFDLSVKMRGHQFDKKHVELNQPIKIAMARYPDSVIVVKAIVDDRVYGYLSESANRRRRGR